MKLALISFLMPNIAFAVVMAGTYRSPHGTVQVVPLPEKYRVHIMTQYNQFTCEYEGVGEEVDEGSLRFKDADCTLAIDQDDEAGRTLSVKVVRGCGQWCGAGATLDIPHARR